MSVSKSNFTIKYIRVYIYVLMYLLKNTLVKFWWEINMKIKGKRNRTSFRLFGVKHFYKIISYSINMSTLSHLSIQIDRHRKIMYFVMCIYGVITSRCLYCNVNIEESHVNEPIQHPVSMLTYQRLKNISS